ncbi:hypothetical protein ACP4OV_008949 [Aristida adscensionis]
MALPRFLAFLLGAALPLLHLYCTEAGGEVGVSYGMVANDLPPVASVVQLLKHNGITMVRIYDANSTVLTSLANSGIRVTVMMPNDDLAAAARDPSFALQWVRTNVQAYRPATQITGVDVGNEVFTVAPKLAPDLVPAMTNVQAALAQLGLADAVKVSTPVAIDALKASYPPSKGRFKDEIAQPVMKPMLDFLRRTGSSFSLDVYPFFAYDEQPYNISLDYALGNSNDGETDPKTSLTYYSLLNAQIDATNFAMEALGVSDVTITVIETGWASRGERRAGPGRGRRRLLANTCAASIANARAYNNNVINRVLAVKTCTPHRPRVGMDVYIFALFNENNKGYGPDDREAYFGLFYPNMTKVYSFDFVHGTGGPPPQPRASWCVAKAAVGDTKLQESLDWACGHGADCSAIQRGGACFDPDNMVAHASYAFNSYYQNKRRAGGTCDFSGAATVVYKAPNIGNCVLPSKV